MENNYINLDIKMDGNRLFIHSENNFNKPIFQYSYKRKVMIFFLTVKMIQKSGYRQGGFKMY